ncbi:hypothetical protein KO498_02465 [Lentibacter algarum]|uniref:sulfotransferase n=1 Tax=Lentibacter algarum TaxID=576131 RepID=UPI001C0704BB|nr:sulfotransferase [Lentibacter algarum]MBU2980668.1 hypothetical protein [Lentibacter algarum]
MSNSPMFSHRIHIICSPYKTASSSVEQALVDIGVAKKPMPYSRAILRDNRELLLKWRQTANAAKTYDNFVSLHSSEVFAELSAYLKPLRKFDIFADAPFGHTHTHSFVRKLVAPKAVHIWINRDFDAWVDSVHRWEVSHPEIYAGKLKIWDTDPDRRLLMLRRLWNTNYRAFAELRGHFPDDCLELQFEELGDYTSLAAFYGVQAPAKPFPLRNVNS